VTTEQLWEYCELHLYDSQRRDGAWFYSLAIRYHSEHGRLRVLSTMDRQDSHGWAVNPWAKAMGLLGQAGWELVSVQHGNLEAEHKALLRNEAVAYFKRPVQPGRGIDEPALVLEG
jgi:hypothetical protein